MKIARKQCGFAIRRVCAAALVLTICAAFSGSAGDIKLDVLNTRTGSFTNVTVYKLSRTDIFFRYDLGVANAKIRDLDETALWQLHLSDSPPASVKSSATAKSEDVGATQSENSINSAGSRAASSKFAISKVEFAKLKEQLLEKLKPVLGNLKTKFSEKPSPAFLGIAAALVFAVYLFGCHCLSLICLKTGNEPGMLVWLPILQIFPTLRAAGMSGFWFLALLIPGLNLLAQIVWSFKIASARGKSAWVGFFLLLPGISLFAFLYLAFSNGVSHEAERKPVRIAGSPAALAEA